MQETTVLFVDDESDILHSVQRQFRKESFRVLTAESGEKALEILKDISVQVLISDERMPGMDGIQLLDRVKESYPDIIRVLLSGYTDTETILRSINKGEVFRFVTKPWEKEELLEIIALSIEQYGINLKEKEYMQSILEENRCLKVRLRSRCTPLNLDTEVLNRVSRPLAALSGDDQIDRYNDLCENLFQGKLRKGSELGTIFPEELKKRIIEGLELPGGMKAFNVEINGLKTVLYTRALRSCDPVKGLLFIVKEENETKTPMERKEADHDRKQ